VDDIRNPFVALNRPVRLLLIRRSEVAEFDMPG
jgi:hypothetical protein